MDEQFGSRFCRALSDALLRLQAGSSRAGASPRVHVFPQAWENTACGFPEIGGDCPTLAHTVVIFDPTDDRHAFVYHDLRFAYEVHRANDDFFADLRDETLKGAAEYRGEYESPV